MRLLSYKKDGCLQVVNLSEAKGESSSLRTGSRMPSHGTVNYSRLLEFGGETHG